MRIERAVLVALALVFALCLAVASTYRWQVALGPALASGIGLTLCILQLALTWRATEGRSIPPLFDYAHRTQFLWRGCAVGAVTLLGFGIGGSIYVFCHIYFETPKRRLVTAGLSAAATIFVVYGVFETLLQTRLFAGLLLT